MNRSSGVGITLSVMLIAAVVLVAGDNGSRPVRERAAIHDRIVAKRLDTVLGPAMRANNIQMWIVLGREYNPDPVFPFVTPDGTYPGAGNAYVFIDRGTERPLRVVVGSHQFKQSAFFDRVIAARGNAVGVELRKLAEEFSPKRIGINIARQTSAADGLTHSFQLRLVEWLGPDYAGRMVSAERLVIDFLDTRIAEEEELFREAAELTRSIWTEAFSSDVIEPGKTTVGDVLWFIRQRCADHHVGTWFRPDIRLQRRGVEFTPGSVAPDNMVIERGDVLHVDFGIEYLDFSTDYQKHFYVPHEGETEVPAGLKAALANTNRLQDIVMGEIEPGLTGQEVFEKVMAHANESGLQAMIYSHSIGHFGHFVGAAIGQFSGQPGLRGTLPMRAGSYTSIELNTRTAVSEWDGQEVWIMMEDDAYLSPDGMRFFLPRQTEWFVIE